MSPIAKLLTGLVLLGLMACDSASTPPDQQDAGPDDGDDGDGTEPILERPAQADYACSVVTPAVRLESRSWPYGGKHALASTAGDATWFARSEGVMEQGEFFPQSYKFVISRMGATGTLGEDQVLQEDGSLVKAPALLALDEGKMALAWAEGPALRLGFLDAQGALSSPITTLTSDLGERATQVSLVRAGAGEIGVALRPGGGPVRLLVVDETGKSLSDWLTVGKGSATAGPELLFDGTNFSLLWAETEDDGSSNLPSNVFFARATRAGKALTEPTRFTTFGIGSGPDDLTSWAFAPPKVDLVATSSGLLAAWTEATTGEPDNTPPDYGSGGTMVLMVGKVDATGKLLGTPAVLAKKEDSIEFIEPDLVPFGDTVALFWGRGSYIDICGGCVPDHTVSMVLLDPETLNPRSNVVQVTPEAGGFLGRQVAVQGDRLITTFEETFHTNAMPALAVFECLAKP